MIIDKKILVKQLLLLINEEKKFYNNYDNNILVNHVKYIEILYNIINTINITI